MSQIPRCHETKTCVAKLVEIKYHEVMMLLLRPSPAIPHPSHESLKLCHYSAVAVIRDFDELYRGDFLPYTWPACHSVFLATISMLFCIWNVPSVTRTTKLETLMADLNSAIGILGALGEHWTSAKRSRELLDELSQTTIRWLIDLELKALAPPVVSAANTSDAENEPPASAANDDGNGTQSRTTEEEASLVESSPFLEAVLTSDHLSSMLSCLDDTNPTFDIDSIMQGVFSDYYQSDVEFGHSFPLETGPFTV
jgi:hypothetical protein